MLKTAKSVRRKQVTEAISKRFVECDNKLLTTTLKVIVVDIVDLLFNNNNRICVSVEVHSGI